MARVKIRLADNVARCVLIDPDATDGARLGTNLYMADGSVATPAAMRTWLGVTNGPSGSGVAHHRLLQGLTLGDDHPQYTAWAQDEAITGQWQWAAALWGPNGSAAAPSFTFVGDTDLGFYRYAADTVGLATDGVNRWRVDNAAITTTLPHIGPVGSESLPTYTFVGHTGTGLSWWAGSAGDELRFTTGGVHRGDIGADGLDFNVPFRAASGTAAAPAYSFSGDTNTGVRRPAADTLALVTGGADRITVGPAGQLGVGGATYGNAKDVLQSAGAGAAPSWVASGPRYIYQTAAEYYWSVSDFVRGNNVIGVRYAGPAIVYLPHTLPVEYLVTVKDEAGTGDVTVRVY